MIKPFRGDYPITQLWGRNPDMYARFNLRGHNGIDYGLPEGTDLYAPHDGKIIEAAFDAGGYGIYYKIENKLEGSVLGHMKENYLSVGATVSEGQLIGKSGNTGNSTGPHLHWGYYWFPRDRGDGYNGFINQIPMLGLYEYYKNLIETITAGQTTQSLHDDLKRKYGELQEEMKGLVAKKDAECQQRVKTMKETIIKFVSTA